MPNQLPQPQHDLIEFFDFIYERQLLWHNRFVVKSDPPWTENQILQQYKFCNVYRELDRCTQYLIKRVINNPALTNSQKVFAILVFRIFNQDGLFDKYFTEVPSWQLFDAQLRIKQLDEAKARGLNLFNDAYNITQRTYCDEHRKGEKHVQHLLNLGNIANNWHDTFWLIETAKNPKQIFDAITALNFYGPFVAYQCVTDISYIKGFKNLNWNEFCYAGPGAKPGIESIFTVFDHKHEYFVLKVFNDQAYYFNDLYRAKGKHWKSIAYTDAYNTYPFLSVSNLQSCFCEWRKYLARKAGTGRVKYYKGAANGLS